MVCKETTLLNRENLFLNVSSGHAEFVIHKRLLGGNSVFKTETENETLPHKDLSVYDVLLKSSLSAQKGVHT
mgnify:CR=1 FL=1